MAVSHKPKWEEKAMGRKITERTSHQAKTITEARLRKGYSQQKVASLIGVSIGQYQRLENGERNIRYTSMKIWIYYLFIDKTL